MRPVLEMDDRAVDFTFKIAESRYAAPLALNGIVFVVDDNLIGHKKAIKSILRDIVRWQQERAYPLTLFT